MLVSERLLRAFDLTKRPEVTAIRKGINYSGRRVSLLKCGKTFSKVVSNKQDNDEVSRSRILSMSPRDSKLGINCIPIEVIEKDQERLKAYNESLVVRFRSLGSKLDEPILRKPNKKRILVPAQSTEKVENLCLQDKSKMLTEFEIMQISQNRFGWVRDPDWNDLLVNCHATSLRMQRAKKLERKLQEVEGVREKLFLNLSPRSQKSVPSLELKCSEPSRLKPKLNVMNSKSLKRLTECLFTSPSIKSPLSPRFKEHMKSSICKTEPSGYLPSTSNLASQTRDHYKDLSTCLELAENSYEKRTKKPSNQQKASKNKGHNSLATLFKPNTKQFTNFERLVFKKSKKDGYLIKNLDREKERKNVHKIISSKKSEDQRVAGLLGE